jgi:hypothetical protein
MATQYTPRAARSVHLWYPPGPFDVFYNELTVKHSTRGSYFMACGFTGGYFGIQELGDGNKIALFSVWDAHTGDDKNAVPADKRVECVFQAEGVTGDRFGDEGTGGQRFYSFPWKLDQLNRFCVTSTVMGQKTDFAGYLYLPTKQAWQHLATLRTNTGGRNLDSTYSFIEDFRRDGASANETRRALFGNAWMRKLDGSWTEATSTIFTASSNPEQNGEAIDRLDAGKSETGQFYLQTGGPTPQTTQLRSQVNRPSTGQRPTDLPV